MGVAGRLATPCAILPYWFLALIIYLVIGRVRENVATPCPRLVFFPAARSIVTRRVNGVSGIGIGRVVWLLIALLPLRAWQKRQVILSSHHGARDVLFFPVRVVVLPLPIVCERVEMGRSTTIAAPRSLAFLHHSTVLCFWVHRALSPSYGIDLVGRLHATPRAVHKVVPGAQGDAPGVRYASLPQPRLLVLELLVHLVAVELLLALLTEIGRAIVLKGRRFLELGVRGPVASSARGVHDSKTVMPRFSRTLLLREIHGSS